MIASDVEKAINGQINQEMTAAYNYLGMSGHFEQENLSGFANWCFVQYQEELAHAMRLFRYLCDRGGQVELAPIPSPKCSYADSKEVFATALAQEEANTASINQVYELAASASDHATISHLQWFLDEQVEEEASVGEILALVERAGTDPNAIFYLNDKLGARQEEAAEG